MKSKLVLFFAALVACVAALPAATVRISFDARNPAGAAHYVMQRRASAAAWVLPAVEPVVGPGTVIAMVTTRSSGAVTVTQSGQTITASADLFTAADVLRQIRFGTSGPVDFIAGVTGPRAAVAATNRVVAATVCTIFAERLELVDPGVMPGLWVYRGTAQRPDGSDRNPVFSTDSNVANVPVNAPASLEVLVSIDDPGLINVSTRGVAGVGDDAMIVGFYTVSPRTLLVRHAGPSLAQFGLSGVIAQPRLTLMRGAQPVAVNAGWADDPALAAAATRVNAFPFLPGSRDAALLITLDPGGYTVICEPSDGVPGRALGEVYLLN